MHDDKVLAAGQQVTSQAAPNISSQKSYARERVQSLIGAVCLIFFSTVYFYIQGPRIAMEQLEYSPRRNSSFLSVQPQLVSFYSTSVSSEVSSFYLGHQ